MRQSGKVLFFQLQLPRYSEGRYYCGVLPGLSAFPVHVLRVSIKICTCQSVRGRRDSHSHSHCIQQGHDIFPHRVELCLPGTAKGGLKRQTEISSYYTIQTLGFVYFDSFHWVPRRLMGDVDVRVTCKGAACFAYMFVVDSGRQS
jgi:hypothetical protein